MVHDARHCRWTIVAAALTSSPLGCGNGADSGPAGPMDAGSERLDIASVSRTESLDQLTDAEKATVCDWVNTKQGGYGRQVLCDKDPPVSTDASLSACIGSIAGFAELCPLTVGQLVDCAQATGADLCQVYTLPTCEVIATCLRRINGTD